MKDKNKKIYNEIEMGEALSEPSCMGIIPRDQNFDLSEIYLKNVIEGIDDFILSTIKEIEVNGVESFELTIEYQDENYTVLIAKTTNDPEYLQTLSFVNSVGHDLTQQALNAKYYIDISLMFHEDAIESYFFQLKLMNAIVPDACLGIDFSAMTVFSPDWLKMLVDANVPPAPKYLYTIHAVYDGEEDNRIYWLHTHGLLRCGSMELEVVNLKHGPQEVYNMLNYAASLFIQNHYNENESFAVGYDGLNLSLTWIRWEDALKRFPSDILGGLDERQDEDDVHAGPSGILFAVEEGILVSPELYVETLKDNPIYYISNVETARMRALAFSQLDKFKQTFERFGKKVEEKGLFSIFKKKKSNDNEGWTFLVKLGLVVDQAENEKEREHLWFEVISIDGNNVTARLKNTPYWIAKLKESEVYTYPMSEVLTDWIIYSPEATYSPDVAYLLN